MEGAPGGSLGEDDANVPAELPLVRKRNLRNCFNRQTQLMHPPGFPIVQENVSAAMRATAAEILNPASDESEVVVARAAVSVPRPRACPPSRAKPAFHLSSKV